MNRSVLRESILHTLYWTELPGYRHILDCLSIKLFHWRSRFENAEVACTTLIRLRTRIGTSCVIVHRAVWSARGALIKSREIGMAPSQVDASNCDCPLIKRPTPDHHVTDVLTLLHAHLSVSCKCFRPDIGKTRIWRFRNCTQTRARARVVVTKINNADQWNVMASEISDARRVWLAESSYRLIRSVKSTQGCLFQLVRPNSDIA